MQKEADPYVRLLQKAQAVEQKVFDKKRKVVRGGQLARSKVDALLRRNDKEMKIFANEENKREKILEDQAEELRQAHLKIAKNIKQKVVFAPTQEKLAPKIIQRKVPAPSPVPHPVAMPLPPVPVPEKVKRKLNLKKAPAPVPAPAPAIVKEANIEPRGSAFRVRVYKEGKRVIKSFKTLADAKTFRDANK
jgi:hypothetical protein